MLIQDMKGKIKAAYVLLLLSISMFLHVRGQPIELCVEKECSQDCCGAGENVQELPGFIERDNGGGLSTVVTTLTQFVGT